MDQRPTKCKLRLTVLESYYIKLKKNSLHRKRRLCKKGHRATRWSFTRCWHCFGQQMSGGTARSVGGGGGAASCHTQVPLLGFVVFAVVRVDLFVWTTVQSARAGAQSHISSGISCGLRMPGTDIWILCFSSWACRSDASLSSRNRSEVSSPANSWNGSSREHAVRKLDDTSNPLQPMILEADLMQLSE